MFFKWVDIIWGLPLLMPAIITFGREIKNKQGRFEKFSLGIDAVGVLGFLVILSLVATFLGSLFRERGLFRQIIQVISVAGVTEALNWYSKKKEGNVRNSGVFYLMLAINSLLGLIFGVALGERLIQLWPAAFDAVFN